MKTENETQIIVWSLAAMKVSEHSPALWLCSEEDGVPELGVYVLGRHDRGTWIDHTDQEGCNYVWVKRMIHNHPCPNNDKHYEWNQFGPDCFVGQEITHWCYVSRVPDESEAGS